mgnify:CR=1 FL=1
MQLCDNGRVGATVLAIEVPEQQDEIGATGRSQAEAGGRCKYAPGCNILLFELSLGNTAIVVQARRLCELALTSSLMLGEFGVDGCVVSGVVYRLELEYRTGRSARF